MEEAFFGDYLGLWFLKENLVKWSMSLKQTCKINVLFFQSKFFQGNFLMTQILKSLLQWHMSACQRIDAFELWCQRQFLRVPWTARISNLSILKEINLEYALEELMLKLKLWYFGHLMQTGAHWKSPWCWERLRAEEEGVRGWDGRMASPMQWTELGQTLGDGEGQGGQACWSPRGHKESDRTRQVNNNNDLITIFFFF